LLAAAFFITTPLTRATIFGSIRGIVHDPQHRPIAGAQVKLQSRTSHWEHSAQTDQDGVFQFDAVPIGEYTIMITRAGFLDVTQHEVVQSGSSPVLHFPMNISTVSQRVEVKAEPGTIDVETSTTETLVFRSAIEQTPGANRTNSLAMITDYVPGAYMVHDQLHIRGGHQVSWLVDGVPVPNTSIASNVGPQFDPKDVDYLEVQRGGYAADYGDRTFGVFNVVPRTGFERDNDAEILSSYGSFNQTNDQISLGGHTQRFAYYTSFNGNRSEYGLQTPVEPIIHDMDNGFGGFGPLLFNATANDQLRLVTSLRRDFYQVPNTRDQQAPCAPVLPMDATCNVRDTNRESDAFVNFSWVHTLSPGAVVTVSPFYHYNTALFDGSPNDQPSITVDHRASNYAGVQSSLAIVKGKNSLRTGLYVYGQHDNSFFSITPNPLVTPATSQHEISWGNLQSIFLEDQFKATPWLTLNGGIRLTHFQGTVNENAADPRVGAALRVPKLNWTFRGFYGRYYQASPLDAISGTILANQTFLPLHGERDEQWEIGLAIPLHGWVFDTDYFHTAAHNFLDHDVIGNSNIFLPLTIQYARIHAWETTVRSPELFRRARVHLAYSHQYAQAAGPVTGGLTNFTPPPVGYFYLDHDQRDTLSTGYQIQLPARAWTSGNLNFGSGFLNANGPEHLPSHTTFDLSLGKSFGDRLALTFTAINVTNSRYLVDTSNSFGGTHFNESRQFIAQLRWRFRY
jgi:outer membrane receptor protein involved in Fe transport